jgi:hypothetical protein
VDIIVTTPKSLSEDAKHEADMVLKKGGGVYFRVLKRKPKKLNRGDRVFYVEDGFVRGFCKVFDVRQVEEQVCSTTKRVFSGGWCLFMDATTWSWIRPIPMKGFQGYRYSQIPEEEINIIGTWKDKKPKEAVL